MGGVQYGAYAKLFGMESIQLDPSDPDPLSINADPHHWEVIRKIFDILTKSKY